MTKYDVAVIGCGPVGAVAAILLARAGMKTLVVDQDRAPYPLPRAVHVDHEAMRILQSAGLMDRLRAGFREGEGHLHVGADHGVIRYLGAAGLPKPFGWANDYFFYQPDLEAELRQALAKDPRVDLKLGLRLEALRQDAETVAVDLVGEQGAEQVAVPWVIACDGARSTVRKQLGVTLDDLDFEEPWLVVDVEVEGDIRVDHIGGAPPDADLQSLAITACDPVRPTTTVPGRGHHRRWEFMLLPGEDDQEMMRPERIYSLLAPWITGVPHRLIRAATYRFHGLIAERWRVGRVFLAGDAAHQTPPFFGQGMCHGLRDAANLAFKLGLVARGLAAPDLLETYQQERDPHVRRVIAASVEAGRYICVLDPEAAAARDRRMRQPAQGAARTAADLIPPIQAGLVRAGTPGAGQRFIQPWVETTAQPALLDDLQDLRSRGPGWRLFACNEAIAHRANRLISTLLPDVEVAVIQVDALKDTGALSGWLAAHRASAVTVRPDFYVFGTAQGEDDVDALVIDLANQLWPHSPSA